MTTPRVHIAHLPTPVEPLPRLSALLGGPEIFCKRDDQTGLGFGGNKTRKLEFLLADAQLQGAKTLITTGAIQSNHCRQTAALAARCGFECILVLSGTEPEIASGNLFLDRLFGAQIAWCSREDRDATLESVFIQAKQAGKKPYLIPYGASNEIGILGYVEAMQEVKSQVEDIDWMVVASSSGGTQAGMLLGAGLSGFTGKILGISIDANTAELKGIVRGLCDVGASKIPGAVRVRGEDILVNDHYLGGGYAVMGQPEVEAIQLFASQEGLLLDPVYTGRAAAGMIDLIRKGFFHAGERLLFWHTGGTPVLFAEPYTGMLQQT